MKTAKGSPPIKRYTLTVKGEPAGAVVKTIAAQLGKELRYDAAVGEKLQQTVSLEVREVSLEELLAKTLGPVGLTGRINETALEVIAK